MNFSNETFDNDTPVADARIEGPFAKVYGKTAKQKSKFFMDFIKPSDLRDLNHYLVGFQEYIEALGISVYHYFRHDLDEWERVPPPKPLTLLPALNKPDFDHPKLRQRPALERFDPDLEAD